MFATIVMTSVALCEAASGRGPHHFFATAADDDATHRLENHPKGDNASRKDGPKGLDLRALLGGEVWSLLDDAAFAVDGRCDELPSALELCFLENTQARRLAATPAPTSAYACIQAQASTPFSPVANDIEAALVSVGSHDDATESLPLPFSFPWFGTTLTNVVVSTNGQLNMDGSTDDNCCEADPITQSAGAGSSYGGDRVAFAQEDLDPSSGGSIFTLGKESSFVISFEGVPFYSESDEVLAAVANVQVELFETGEIEIRWGPGHTGGNTFAAGVASDAESVYAPVLSTAAAAFVDGVTDTWPANDGVHFYCGLRTAISEPPTSVPTISLAPTLTAEPTPLPTTCRPGQYVQKKGTCAACFPGTYSETGHESECTSSVCNADLARRSRR